MIVHKVWISSTHFRRAGSSDISEATAEYLRTIVLPMKRKYKSFVDEGAGIVEETGLHRTVGTIHYVSYRVTYKYQYDEEEEITYFISILPFILILIAAIILILLYLA